MLKKKKLKCVAVFWWAVTPENETGIFGLCTVLHTSQGLGWVSACSLFFFSKESNGALE